MINFILWLSYYSTRPPAALVERLLVVVAEAVNQSRLHRPNKRLYLSHPGIGWG